MFNILLKFHCTFTNVAISVMLVQLRPFFYHEVKTENRLLLYAIHLPHSHIMCDFMEKQLLVVVFQCYIKKMNVGLASDACMGN